jgi:hypothetical protein
MIKLLITATSFLFGGAGVVLVGYMSANPRAFTHPAGELPAVAASPMLAAAPVAVETKGKQIVLPEVLITAYSRGAKKQKVVLDRLEPCSEWDDVGAMFIDPAGATGVRRARALCSRPSRQR